MWPKLDGAPISRLGLGKVAQVLVGRRQTTIGIVAGWLGVQCTLKFRDRLFMLPCA
jgi:hypothetical protein